MRLNFKVPASLAIASLLGLALCTSVSVGTAQAQGKMKDKKPSKMTSDRMMSDHDRMSDMDEDEIVPLMPAYPMSAPGALDLNHWTDYTAKHMAPGSATAIMMEKRSDRMDKTARMEHMEDEDELVPVVPSYPNAAPGNLDLNHWTDYTKKHMAPGSATDAKMDKMAHDKMATMMHEEDEEDLVPMTPSYPNAAPGSLDLNHWTDYRRTHMSPGSATDTRMEKMKKKDEKKRMK